MFIRFYVRVPESSHFLTAISSLPGSHHYHQKPETETDKGPLSLLWSICCHLQFLHEWAVLEMFCIAGESLILVRIYGGFERNWPSFGCLTEAGNQFKSLVFRASGTSLPWFSSNTWASQIRCLEPCHFNKLYDFGNDLANYLEGDLQYIPWPVHDGRICDPDEEVEDDVLVELGCSCKGQMSRMHRKCILEWYGMRMILDKNFKCVLCKWVPTYAFGPICFTSAPRKGVRSAFVDASESFRLVLGWMQVRNQGMSLNLVGLFWVWF